jgi:hypothetical protein
MNKNPTSLLIIFVASLMIWLGSCTDCDTADQMPTEPVRFVIVDQDGNNLVTDANATAYHADSIQLMAGTESVPLTKQLDANWKGYVFTSYPPHYTSGNTQLSLQLNRLEKETLVTYYERHKSKCSDYYSYYRFRYNGWEVQKDNTSGIIKLDKAR